MAAEEKDLLADVDIPVRELKPLQANELVISESRHVVYHCRLPAGVLFEETLTADFWKLAAFKLHVSDLIEIEPLDGSFHATLLVREVSREHAKVAVLHRIDLPSLYPANVDDLPLGYSVQFLGPARLWSAMHGTQILKHSFSTKSDAVEYLKATLR